MSVSKLKQIKFFKVVLNLTELLVSEGAVNEKVQL